MLIYVRVVMVSWNTNVAVIKNRHHCTQDKVHKHSSLPKVDEGNGYQQFLLHIDWPHVGSVPVCSLRYLFDSQSTTPTVTVGAVSPMNISLITLSLIVLSISILPMFCVSGMDAFEARLSAFSLLPVCHRTYTFINSF